MLVVSFSTVSAYLQVPHLLQDSRAVEDIPGVVEDIHDVVVEDSLDEEVAEDNVVVAVEDTQVVQAGEEDVVHGVDMEVAVLLLLVVVAVVVVVAEVGSQHLTSPSSNPEPPAPN